MSAAAAPRAVTLLLRSYAHVLPGMPALMAIGAACTVGGLVAGEPRTARAFAAAGVLFLVAVPGLFAGLHFRRLASYRVHALLPGFAITMVAAVLLLMLVLAGAAALPAARLLSVSAAHAWTWALAALSLLFWFGFLPAPVRFVAGSVLAGLGVSAGTAPAHDIGRVATGIALALLAGGWATFALYAHRRLSAARTFERDPGADWTLPLGLRIAAGPRIDSAAGTLLLGFGDGRRQLLLRAVVAAALLPAVLLALLAWAAGLGAERVTRSPVLALLALVWALAWHAHLAQRAAARLPVLWLRMEGGWPTLYRVFERLLWREWLAQAGTLIAVLLAAWAVRSSAPTSWLQLAIAWLATLLVLTYLPLQRNWPEALRSWAMVAAIALLAGAAALAELEPSGPALAILAVALAFAAVLLRASALRAARGP